MSKESETEKRDRQVYRLCSAVEYCIAIKGYRFTVADVLNVADARKSSFSKYFTSLDDIVDRMNYATKQWLLRDPDRHNENETPYAFPCAMLLSVMDLDGDVFYYMPSLRNFYKSLRFQGGPRYVPHAHRTYSDWASDVLTGGGK